MEACLYPQMASLEEEHWWFLGRRKIVETILKQLVLSPTSQLLDAGCGTGGNLGMLSRFGRIHALELDDKAREFANAKNITEVLPGEFPERLPYFDKQFDLITMLDVLEHIEEDSKTLDILSSLLSQGGYLLITVPAFSFLWSAHDDVHHHKRRYLLSELKNKVKAAGLQVTYASYFNTLLFPVIAGVRLAGKVLPIGSGDSDLKVPHPFLNKMLCNLFASERYVLGRWSLPFGVSAIVLARKP